ncbi:ATP-binding cassette, subfamily B, MsbA [Desulfonauticus submarinus]|uniref:ATP-binding cassette, subfamily B, MsbA n=1 Tax=Desulfonauticus submarinus TaxID=206665 RepID=A0A1H0D3A6_9BACT|nr:ABC transporter transmembrane domain-containing protein [Desulfonauticus submarinus]SDN64625.1 ATP-binding cassette, subfamily B, MsbA [Desulfonauticus submarinus]
MKLQSDWKNINSLKLLKRCLSYFAPYKFRIFISLISMAIVAGCSAAAAFLVKPALDDIFIKKDKDALIFIPIALVVVFILKGIFRFLQNYEMNYCGLKVLEKLRNELHAKIIRLPIYFFDENQTGMLMSRILSDVTLIRSSLPSLVMLIRQVLTMIGLLFVVFYRDPYLATMAVLVLPIAVYPFIYFGKKLRKLGRKNQVKISDISSFLQEVFSGIKVVKAFATEDKEDKNFQKENSRLVNIAVKEIKYNELSSPVMEFIGALGAGLVVWYGGNQVIAGHSTPGTFFSFMTALVMLYDPLKKLTSANLNIQKALAGAERVFQILDSPELSIEQSGNKTLKPPFKTLIFKDVSFTYPGTSCPAVKNINLTINNGEKVAIVGPSGAGKTTLVNLIPRFYLYDSGRIYINGEPIENYSLASLRMFMGIVAQDNFLFNTTIFENICYGLKNADKKKVIAAAKAAYAHDFIMQLPNQYNTIIGERGVKLSGGQKQRLTIARAILKNPPLLILDEATSALDTESERIVQQALDNLMQHRTSIVIAHRLSTILSSDKIVVMDKGKIIAIGKHEELLKKCTLYQKIYEMQFAEE